MPRPQRSNPKTKHRAIKLRTPALAGGAREELTPAERKLWARIRDDQLGVNFRRHTVLADGARDMPSVTTSPTSVLQRPNSSLNLTAVNIWSEKNTTGSEHNIWNQWATKSSAFGIMMC